MSSDAETLTSRPTPSASRKAGEADGLLIAWTADEPSRVGEIAWLDGRSTTIGRGAAEDTALFTARAGSAETVTGSLNNPRLSRKQLVVNPSGTGTLRIMNTGRCRMLRGGRAAEHADLKPGQTIELERELVLQYVRRPRTIEIEPGAIPAFGEADADGIVGESPATWALRAQIAFVARRRAHVLLLGPSGSGKELAARAIHRQSERATQRFVSRNAATIPESLIDAELFGNVRGYPNPGMAEHRGLIGEAHGGTLFLDEIGELSHTLQAHLLRVLDSGEYQRLGDATPRTSDFRMIAATNRGASELKADVCARFALQLPVPGLSERRDDIPFLIGHVLRTIAARDTEIARRFFDAREETPRISPALVQQLVELEYSTHVRELQGNLWRAMLNSTGDTLESVPLGDAAPIGPYVDEPWYGDPMSIPREVAIDCMKRHNNVQELVWRELGLSSRHVLFRMLKRMKLTDAEDSS